MPSTTPAMIPLQRDRPIWERFFCVAPLVIVGTCEPDGTPDLAPKHMVTPLSWKDHFGFVCTPAHATYRNIQRDRTFTVSFPRPSQVLLASLAAAPRDEQQGKPALSALPTVAAQRVTGVLVEEAYLHLECELDRIVDGFADNSLVAGRILAARVAEDALRDPEIDDQDLIAHAPLLAYLHPGRIATIAATQAFPFHAGWSR